MIKKMDTKYTDIGCLDIPKLWYTYRKKYGIEEVADRFIEACQIQTDDFDNVAACK